MEKEERLKLQKKLREARNRLNFVRKHDQGKGGLYADLPYSKPDMAMTKILKEQIMALHKKLDSPYPPPEPPPPIIIDNPKPDWMPKMICTMVQLPFNVGQQYSWEELEAVIIELCLAGCDAIRIFAWGWEPYIEAFRKTTTGKYTFFRPNPEWDTTLEKFGALLHKYYMSLEVDGYDNCSARALWNPFANNTHNFSSSFYGYKNLVDNGRDEEGKIIKVNEVDFMIEHWDDRIIDCLDFSKGDKYRLGNELKSHVENDTHERKHWAEDWGVKRAKHAFDRGMPWPISFSGSKITGHKLLGFISAEEHGKDAKPHNGDEFPCEDYGWTYRTAAQELHGLGTPEHVEAKIPGKLSQIRMFSDDDDGVGTNPDSKVPEDQQGYCEIRKNGRTYACTANTPTRIAAAGAFMGKIGNRTFCYSLGFLPRSILYKGKTVFDRFDIEVDAKIYSQLAMDLWNVDITRKRSTA